MSQLKEIEGRYYKECNVVMLPTESMSNIYVNKYINETHKISPIMFDNKPYMDSEEMKQCGLEYQHLYITSDDEIKEGDWYINSANKRNYINRSGNTKFDSLYDDCKKIIATTDKSLTYNHCEIKEIQAVRMEGRVLKSLPQPSQSFIKKYCELGGIDKVLIEYTYNRVNDHDHPYLSIGSKYNYRPKIDFHNTITIKPVKERMYSREEVEQILFDYAEQEHAWFSSKSEIKSFNNWIKENL